MRHSRWERSRGVIFDHGERRLERGAGGHDGAVDVHGGRLGDL